MIDSNLENLIGMMVTGILAVVALAVVWKLSYALGQALRHHADLRRENSRSGLARNGRLRTERIEQPLWQDPRYENLFQLNRRNNPGREVDDGNSSNPSS